jgi:predicted tellurium resistance membrane protein TerC
MKKQQSVTSLPPSPEEERKSRMVKYSIAMSIRMVCLILVFVVQGWWVVVVAIGAIVLPYIAVVIANVGSRTSTATRVLPGYLAIGQKSSEPRD